MVKDKFLDDRKARFLAAAIRAAKVLGISKEEFEVRFWDCPEFTGEELAHCHYDTRLICVSERELSLMNYDLIEEVASHEITHLKDEKCEHPKYHSPEFYRRHDAVQQEMWTPPSGVTHIRRSSKKIKLKGKKSTGVVKSKCNLHQCQKRRKTNKCDYCEDYFCSEHIRPKEPRMRNTNSSDALDRYAKLDKGGHPCPDFLNHKLRQQGHYVPKSKSQNEKTTSSKSSTEEKKPFDYNYFDRYGRDQPEHPTQVSSTQHQESHEINGNIIVIAIGIIIAAILVSILLF